MELGEEKEAFVNKKIAVQKMKQEYLNEWKTIEKREMLCLNSEAEKYLYENDRVSKISRYSRQRLSKLNVKENLQLREMNAKYLNNLIAECKAIQVCVDTIESAPLYVPIYTEKRELLQNWLREADIFAPILWPVSACIEAEMTEDVQFIFSHLLALPCDQRYGKDDMERIFERIYKFELSVL